MIANPTVCIGITGPPSLVETPTHRHHQQPDAIGTRVQVTTKLGTYSRVVAGGSGCSSMNDPLMLVGLGAATRVGQVRVHWPSRVWQQFSDLAADQVIEMTEGHATLRKTVR